MTEIDFRIEDVAPAERGFRKALKISSDQWELNVWLTETDIAALRTIRSATWADRKSLQVGAAAGAPVFWSMEDGKLTLTIGLDDETWDVGFTLADTALAAILKAI